MKTTSVSRPASPYARTESCAELHAEPVTALWAMSIAAAFFGLLVCFVRIGMDSFAAGLCKTGYTPRPSRSILSGSIS